jgi:hypothetical protein
MQTTIATCLLRVTSAHGQMRCQQRPITLLKSATIGTWKRTPLCGVTVNGLPPQGSCSAVELRLAKALIDAVVNLAHPLLQLLL